MIGSEINPGRLDPEDFSAWDIHSDSHIPFVGTSKNDSPRMIHADDRRHLGYTNVGFLDGHAEARRLSPEHLPVRAFNPFDSR